MHSSQKVAQTPHVIQFAVPIHETTYPQVHCIVYYCMQEVTVKCATSDPTVAAMFPQIAGGPVPHPVLAPLQASPSLHLGRGGRCSGPLPHTGQTTHASATSRESEWGSVSLPCEVMVLVTLVYCKPNTVCTLIFTGFILHGFPYLWISCMDVGHYSVRIH